MGLPRPLLHIRFLSLAIFLSSAFSMGLAEESRKALRAPPLATELRSAILQAPQSLALAVIRQVFKTDLAATEDYSVAELQSGCTEERRYRNMGSFMGCSSLGIDILRNKMRRDLLQAQEEEQYSHCAILKLALRRWPTWQSYRKMWKMYSCDEYVFNETE